MVNNRLLKKFIIALLLISQLIYAKSEPENSVEIKTEASPIEKQEIDNTQINEKIINKIIIEGSTLNESAVRAKLPYREKDIFDPLKTKKLIDNLMSMGYFNNVEIQIEDISSTSLNLYIVLTQKKRVEEIIYKGNEHLNSSDIEKKLKLSFVPAMDEDDLKHFSNQIKNLYAEKNYHAVTIKPQLELTPHDTVKAIFDITEGKPSVVKRVNFKGNKAIASKRLRGLLFTREDWILGFMDKAGSFQPEALEYDKHQIENFYQSNGYLAARVKNIQVERDPQTPEIVNVTYEIEEGDLYTVNSISVPGNELIKEDALLASIPIRAGQLYSRELIRKSIEALRLIWGQFGYIYADIDPMIQPNFENKTVDITLHSELGSKVFLNRLIIVGNKKTRDYVIRRVVSLNEGDILTTQGMEQSKAAVEALGFFDPRTGVNWKINKIDENTADVELILQEAKTGRVYGQVGFGGADRDPKSPASSLKVSAGMGDRNFLGTGIYYNLSGSYSKEDRGLLFTLGNSWLFDRPITGAIEAYHRRTTYEEFKNLQNVPVEIISGGSLISGFSPYGYINTRILFNTGIERIRYANDIVVLPGGKTEAERLALQDRLSRQFQPGTFSWVGGSIGQDFRNSPVHTNRGYQWSVNTKAGLPVHSNFGFVKVEGDATWVTPIIGEYDLIFILHTHGGYIKASPGKVIPYRELFHLGGPATVRGFNFGQIGPNLFGDSLGGTKAFWVNAELVFNVTKDFSIKGVLFYDGGASWDTPDVNPLFANHLKNNRFRYRHAIGFGVRLTNPAPMKIDWGFKLDRNKKRGESLSEVHFTMAQEF